jgi:hypothetical protein
LPPVSRGGEAIDFVHYSRAWQELDPKICYITEQHRQTQTGDALLDLLQAMRRGEVNELHEAMLQDRLGRNPDDGQVVTRLYSHNIDVDAINNDHLAALEGKRYTYRMRTSGSAAKVEQFTKTLLAPAELTLAEDAEVMFVANDYAKGFANGTRGRVVDFENGQPVVELASGKRIRVEPHEWSLTEDGKTKATATQLPLRLAWAITIHKSQGMSLDGAVIDLSRSFTPGMGYVALSRVRSVDGVFLQGINNMALRLHPDIYEFDRRIADLSSRLAENLLDAPDEAPDEPAEVTVVDQLLLQKLKTWRRQRAETDGMPAYIVAHDSTLELLAAVAPLTSAGLRGVKGFGPKKVETYGPDILAVIARHMGV